MSAAPTEDQVVVLDVDLTQELVCCQDGCGRPAEWRAHITHVDDGSHCQTPLWCAHHKTVADMVFAMAATFGGLADVVCTGRGHGHRVVTVTWSQL